MVVSKVTPFIYSFSLQFLETSEKRKETDMMNDSNEKKNCAALAITGCLWCEHKKGDNFKRKTYLEMSGTIFAGKPRHRVLRSAPHHFWREWEEEEETH